MQEAASPSTPEVLPDALTPTAEDLVRQSSALVQRLTCQWCGTVEEAREAAQEAFVNLLEALPRFRGDCALSTWVYRITLNTCRGRGRRGQLRRSRETPLDQDPADTQPTRQEQLETEEQRHAVQRAVAQLADDYRVPVVLHYQQNLRYEEIAEILGIPLGTVKVRLFRAKRLLRHSLEAVNDQAARPD